MDLLNKLFPRKSRSVYDDEMNFDEPPIENEGNKESRSEVDIPEMNVSQQEFAEPVDDGSKKNGFDETDFDEFSDQPNNEISEESSQKESLFSRLSALVSRKNKNTEVSEDSSSYVPVPKQTEDISASSSHSKWDDLPKPVQLGILSVIVGVITVGILASMGKISLPWQSEENIGMEAPVPADMNEKTESVPSSIALASNPFVELQAYQAANMTAMTAPVVPGTLPAIPSTNPAQPTTAPLPVIPSSPVPVTETLPPIPSSQSVMPVPATMSASAAVSVQGVMVGEDGNSAAILSDGSVIKNGESFKDGRIAFIGGDGITFDDGSKLTISDPR